MNLKRGMSTFNVNDIPLKFSTYLNRKALPSVPLRFGHVLADVPKGGWGMLGNDTFGDCAVAGIAHGQMVWNWAASGRVPPFADQEIIQQYFALTGGADVGCDPTQVAGWWQSTGLTDSDGTAHKIRSFTGIDKVSQAVEAAYLFGFAGLGLWMPSTAEQQFMDGQPWSDTTEDPNPQSGHYVPLVGRNSAANLMVVTWGRLHAVTPEWLDKYFAGGVAYTSKEYMRSTGVSPEGFNFAQLDSDMAGL